MLKRVLTCICCVLLFAVVFTARADEWNKKTVVTFTRPVELPGIVLPPGKYVFKLLDSLSDRHIVQVFNEDETKIFATILAIPNYRLEPAEETVLRFTERPRTQPEALRAWFYPGDNFGQEFVYPKSRAVHLAEETKAPVLAAPVTPETKTEELVKAPVETVRAQEEEAAVEPQRWAPPEPTKPAEPEPIVEPTPPVPTIPELPATASNIPAMVLIGTLALALAGILALFAKRIA